MLVFGSTGQVATELRRILPDATFLGRGDADLNDPDSCAAAIEEKRPGAVVNAAAYTAVDTAESEEGIAFRVNGEAPGAMARACARLGIPLVQVSTDYVFDGRGDRPFAPESPTAPLGAYGRSKLAGEEAVRDAAAVHAILRSSWVFSAHGANFVKTMLRVSECRDRLRIVADQVGGPTPARAIAEACTSIAATLVEDPGRAGTYHLSGAPDVSWAAFAREIFAQAGRSVTVEEIATTEYPTPARRPLNSRLDCRATEAAFGIPRPDWRAALTEVLEELRIAA